MFVLRKDGQIVSAARNAQAGWPKEELADDHPDLVAFLTPAPAPRRIDLSALLERLTRQEKAAFGAFVLARPDMLTDMFEVAGRGEFSESNPDTVRITDALVAEGVVTRERLAEILAGDARASVR